MQEHSFIYLTHLISQIVGLYKVCYDRPPIDATTTTQFTSTTESPRRIQTSSYLTGSSSLPSPITLRPSPINIGSVGVSLCLRQSAAAQGIPAFTVFSESLMFCSCQHRCCAGRNVFTVTRVCIRTGLTETNKEKPLCTPLLPLREQNAKHKMISLFYLKVILYFALSRLIL